MESVLILALFYQETYYHVTKHPTDKSSITKSLPASWFEFSTLPSARSQQHELVGQSVHQGTIVETGVRHPHEKPVT